MVSIPFVKAHGARNDFLLTWATELPAPVTNRAALAVAICGRHTGVGADGWIVLSPANGADAAIELWNSDGSRSEISGNGTRCAAALLVHMGKAANEVAIATGAGMKRLKLLSHRDVEFEFEMNMGAARLEAIDQALVPGHKAVILNVGNPQCAVLVSGFDFDWRSLGRSLERHPRFPNRTNVSFVRVVERHLLDVRFWERGAGETMSSGTGSAGAGAAAVAVGLAESPVQVDTPAGRLQLRWESDDIFLTGPASLVAKGTFLWKMKDET